MSSKGTRPPTRAWSRAPGADLARIAVAGVALGMLASCAQPGAPESTAPGPVREHVTPAPTPEEGNYRAQWDTEGPTPQESTHIWIVQHALELVRTARPPTRPEATDLLLNHLLNFSADCNREWRRGIHDADFKSSYNDGGEGGVEWDWHGPHAKGWKSHFYKPGSSPGTGTNYRGQQSPTALTRMRTYWRKSAHMASASGGVTPSVCYQLGLAAHYFTDATQPMHAANFTAVDSPFYFHSHYETWAQNSIQPGVSQPDWLELGPLTRDQLLEQAALSAHSSWGTLKHHYNQAVINNGDAIRCHDFMTIGSGKPSYDITSCWTADPSLQADTRAYLQRSIQYTANFMLLWINTMADYGGWANGVTLASYGGTGGSEGELICDPDEVMVGIHGNASSFVNRLGALCATVEPNGTWSGLRQTRIKTTLYGTSTLGTSFTRQCPQGTAVAGFSGSVGVHVDRLALRCRDLPTSTTLTVSEPVGGTGGGAFTSDCAPGMFVRQINVRAGSYVNSIQAHCVDAPKPIAEPESLEYYVSPDRAQDLVVTSQPYGGSGGTMHRVICPGDNDLVVGLHGQVSSTIDKLGAICAPLASDGSIGRVSHHTPSWGGTAGSPFTLQCPTDYAVHGVSLMTSNSVHQVGLFCRHVATSNGVNEEVYVGPVGGTAGTPVDIKTQWNHYLQGFNLWTGTYVNKLQPLDIPLVHELDTATQDTQQLGPGKILRDNQVIHSLDGHYFLMVQQQDGNLVLFQGLSPSDPHATLVWQSGVTYVDPDPEKQEFYLTTTSDGRLAVMKGTSPSNDRGQLWSTPASGASSGLFYLDVEDAGRIVLRKSNGEMVWTSQLFTNWRPGEPNNSTGAENCAVAYSSNGGQWNDVPCGLSTIHYACRSSTDPLEWRITSTKGAFSSGHRACYQQFGASYLFAAPRTPAEQSAFASRLPSTAGTEVWLNLTDEGHEGQWRETGPQSFWRAYEPNNANGNEHCGIIAGSTGWVDVSCTNVARRIACKGPGGATDWKVTRGTSLIVNGDGGMCAAEFGSAYKFGAPMTASEHQALQALTPSTEAFINITDSGHEGIWTYP